MIIFLLTAVPIFYLIMDSFISDLHGRIDDSYKPFVYGLICFIAALIIYNILRIAFIKPVYTIPGVYFYYLFHDSLLQYALAVAGYILIFGISDFETHEHSVNRMFAFMCGFYCLWSVNDLIIEYGWYNSHLFFIIPLQRIGIIAAFTLLFSEALNQDGFLKWLLFAACALLPFITAAGSMFWRLSYGFTSAAITVGLLLVSVFFLYRKIRPRPAMVKTSLYKL